MNADIQAVLDGERRWAVVCADFRDVVPHLPLRCFDHGIHDPPYSEHVHGLQRRMLRGAGGRVAAGQKSGRGQVGPAELGFAALTPEERKAACEASALLVKRWSLFFSDAEGNYEWRRDLEAAGVQHVRVGAWVKECGQPQLSGDRPAVAFEAVEIAHQRARSGRMRWNRGGHPALWAYQIATDRNATGKRLHTTQKPEDLIARLILDFTEPDDIVADWFCGSGTTGAMCMRLGRRFVGIERDPNYAAIATERVGSEAQGVTLGAARVNQRPLFGGAK